MRLDHIAYRVAAGKRDEAAQFFIDAFGYKIQDTFELKFDDEGKDVALCVALEPPEKVIPEVSWICNDVYYQRLNNTMQERLVEFHLAPEIFISEGSESSIVGDWVKSRGGVGGIHHLAYQVDSVEETMEFWKKKGWLEFTTDKPLKCEGLTQVFSKPNILGVVIEFICRPGGRGFCADNVKNLMIASKGD